MSRTDWNTVVWNLGSGSLQWTREIDKWRLHLKSKDCLLALEDSASGLFAYLNNAFQKLPIPSWIEPELKKDSIVWKWDFALNEKQKIKIRQSWSLYDKNSVRFCLQITPSVAIPFPHFSYGLAVCSDGIIDNYCWTQSPTQMSYSFADTDCTLWLLSTYDRNLGIRRFNGCQALVAERPSPTELRFQLRLPPGYAEFSKQKHILKAGETLQLHMVLRLLPGPFYGHVKENWRVQPLEPLPPRYSYSRYIKAAVENFLDPRKYHNFRKGILYYTASDCYHTPEKPRMQVETQGPGWGGAFDCENAYHLVRMAKRDGVEGYKNHARRMLDGFLNAPEFRVPECLTWKHPGDMRGATISTGWWPDKIWTTHQAYMIYHLSEIYRITGWDDCLKSALELSEWFIRNQQPDGSIPALWRFNTKIHPEILRMWRPRQSLPPVPEKGKAVVEYPCQPASCAHMVTALLKLQRVHHAVELEKSAQKLMDVICEQLQPSFARFGNGELDYLGNHAWSMDPTGLSYIIWALADALHTWGKPVYRKLLDRYTLTLLAYGAVFDFKEILLRPRSKVTLPPHGTDIKIAGGITHGNWRPSYGTGPHGYFHYLMNRNEIALALMRAYQETHDIDYKKWLTAFMNWHLYFQFTREVPGSPVLTYGSCPQNHIWTTDWGNWNNDWGVTAMKMAGTYHLLLEEKLLTQPVRNFNGKKG